MGSEGVASGKVGADRLRTMEFGKALNAMLVFCYCALGEVLFAFVGDLGGDFVCGLFDIYFIL